MHFVCPKYFPREDLDLQWPPRFSKILDYPIGRARKARKRVTTAETTNRWQSHSRRLYISWHSYERDARDNWRALVLGILGLGTRYYVACFRYLRCYFQLSTCGPSFWAVPSSSAFAMPIILRMSTACYAAYRHVKKTLEALRNGFWYNMWFFCLVFERETSVSRVVKGFPLLLQHPLPLPLVPGNGLGKESRVSLSGISSKAWMFLVWSLLWPSGCAKPLGHRSGARRVRFSNSISGTGFESGNRIFFFVILFNNHPSGNTRQDVIARNMRWTERLYLKSWNWTTPAWPLISYGDRDVPFVWVMRL